MVPVARRRTPDTCTGPHWTCARTGLSRYARRVIVLARQARTIDFYSVCSFGAPFPSIGSQAKILTHGIAGGAKAQALYDDPAAFVSALSAVYGI